MLVQEIHLLEVIDNGISFNGLGSDGELTISPKVGFGRLFIAGGKSNFLSFYDFKDLFLVDPLQVAKDIEN